MSDTLFKQVNYTASALVDFIALGDIGLPDIQRPFVWKNAKVRDLFDSMFRGYPIGYLLLWQNAFTDGVKTIGTDHKQKTAKLLIVDGQQRLTSLYAVFKGIPVVKSDYSREKIEIAFSPLTQTFEVADAAVRKDPSFIPSISAVWSEDLFDLVDDYLASLGAAREVTHDERQAIKKAITKLHGLKNYPFTALELAAAIDEEQVADVFVRINSKGTPLNQADFILTLMSVFWDEGRKELEDFCRRARAPSTGGPSPFNHYLDPDPDQLLRVSVGLGFRRARLQFVYSILRGKDLQTGEFSEERRDVQFARLKEAQARVLNLTYWHDFLKTVRQAGYLGGRQLTSMNNLIFCYILYLMGRTEYSVPEHVLRRAVARFFFMANLTGRYTGSPESAMEFDLARFREMSDGEDFIAVLDGICDSVLTRDFWEITLPNDLATSAAYSPKLFAYYAALVLLDAQGLYSKQKVADLLEPSVHSTKSAAERHHLFPKEHLSKAYGIESTSQTNQIANYALVEWADNVKIGDKAPSDYVPDFEARFSGDELRDMHYWHALPDGWTTWEYEPFLQRRRELMARVIGDAFETLRPSEGESIDEKDRTLAQLIAQGEGANIEFKSTMRVNLHTRERDPRIELGVLKTIAGFMNAYGGTLMVGVSDDGEVLGLEQDGFPNEDKMNLHLVNLIRDRIGPQFMMYIHPHFDDHDGKRVLAIDCAPSRSPAYVKDGNVERFFVRGGAATSELSLSQAQAYIRERF